ncbi:MAG: hypothetical protein BWY22_00415 [Bacteroidetes bacterium ADurb.Bin217]|nr:MAG: hypothetical protein BWY22_00415 [Bacteroidetes bacterium ADurb.Bin217]
MLNVYNKDTCALWLNIIVIVQKLVLFYHFVTPTL